jgi:hypothetical protein
VQRGVGPAPVERRPALAAPSLSALRAASAARRASAPGPLNRTPDVCYDCGSAPGTRCWLGCAFVRMALAGRPGWFVLRAAGWRKQNPRLTQPNRRSGPRFRPGLRCIQAKPGPPKRNPDPRAQGDIWPPSNPGGRLSLFRLLATRAQAKAWLCFQNKNYRDIPLYTPGGEPAVTFARPDRLPSPTPGLAESSSRTCLAKPV